MRDLHHVTLMLDDRDVRARTHLARRIAEAVLRDNRVRVDDEHDRAHAQRLSVRTPRHEAAVALLVQLVLRHLHRAVLEAFVRGVLCAFGFEPREVFLEQERERKAVVHIRCFFELACALEPAWGGVVSRTRDPADIVVGVERYALLAVRLVDELQAVIANEDCRCTTYQARVSISRGRDGGGGVRTLTRVRLHSLLDGIHRRRNGELEALLVHGQLDRDMR